MESSNHRRLITSMNLLSNILPYFGSTDQCHLMMAQVCKATNGLWRVNEKPLLTMVLKTNRRLVKLQSYHYTNFAHIYNLLKYFKIEFTQLYRDNCKSLYNILDLFDWTYLDFSYFDFTGRDNDSGVWHLLLLRKLLIRGIHPSQIHFDFSLIRDLYQQPEAYISTESEADLKNEYQLEENLTIAKDERQLWNLLRMKISLTIPKIEIDESDAALPYVTYFNRNIKYLRFTDEDIDGFLHNSYQKAIRMFPACEELQLNWYCDDNDEQCTQYDLLFEQIIKTKLRKFDLNPSKKMRGFSIFNKECVIYLFDGVRNKIQGYKANNVNFHYDSNQWSTEYFMLSQMIMALKAPKNFSFENLEEFRGIGRQLDLISYFLENNQSRRSWIFIATMTPAQNEFDFLHIKSEFEKSEDLIKLNAKDIHIVTSSIYQTKQNGNHEHCGHRKDSLLDITYRLNKYSKGIQSKKFSFKDINKTAIELIINGTEVEDDVFEEISDIVSTLPDSIVDIKLNLKNKHQLKYFIKSIKNRRNINQIRFKDDPELYKTKISLSPFALLFKNSTAF